MWTFVCAQSGAFLINQLNAPSPRSFLCRQDLESPFEAGNSLRTLKVVCQRIMIAQSTSGQVYTQPHRKTNHTSVPLNFGWQSCRCAGRNPKPAAIGQLWFIGRHAGRTFLVLSNPDRCSWPAHAPSKVRLAGLLQMGAEALDAPSNDRAGHRQPRGIAT